METGDKVKSPHSLWANDVGTIAGMRNPYKEGDCIIVVFTENDKHEAYQQNFYSQNDLIKLPK